jgi:hypothetical protein
LFHKLLDIRIFKGRIVNNSSASSLYSFLAAIDAEQSDDDIWIRYFSLENRN